ncbi:MAG: TRAP transporter large permease [Clostridiaceae bacterium]|nr:TRAP transporter large permease [Clostridiaceae bacterium]
MSPELIGLLGVVVLIAMICARVWIGAALAIVGFFGIVIMNGWDTALGVIVTAPFTQMDNYTTTAIPMFTLMGMIIAETSIGRNLFDFANKFLGRRRGGVASATVVAAGLMGAVTGSDNVSCVIMSKMALPELKRLNYADSLATASVAAGAPLAILIPPSMAFIMYAMLTENSVGSLFMAGIIPGIVMIIAFVIAITITCTLNPALGPKGEKFTRREKLISLKGVVPVIILFLIVLGSIYAGICTATEAGALGSAGALVIALIGREIDGKKIVNILVETVLAVGFVVFMLVGTFVFIKFIALSQLPFAITALITNLSAPSAIIIIAIGIMYVVLGMLMPQIPMMILTVPLLYPSILALGFDPIWFGVFVVLMMALGAISPPIGMDAFIVSGLSGVPVTTIYKGLWPFIIADIIVIILVAIFPVIVTWLPGIM